MISSIIISLFTFQILLSESLNWTRSDKKISHLCRNIFVEIKLCYNNNHDTRITSLRHDLPKLPVSALLNDLSIKPSTKFNTYPIISGTLLRVNRGDAIGVER